MGRLGRRHFRGPAILSEPRRIFFHFRQVRLAAFDLAILFPPFGGKVFDRLGDLSLFYIFLEFFVDWAHNFSLPPLRVPEPGLGQYDGKLTAVSWN